MMVIPARNLFAAIRQMTNAVFVGMKKVFLNRPPAKNNF